MTDQPSLPGIAQRLELEHMTRGEFINAMVHLYRDELGEATAWRSRIDTTTLSAVNCLEEEQDEDALFKAPIPHRFLTCKKFVTWLRCLLDIHLL